MTVCDRGVKKGQKKCDILYRRPQRVLVYGSETWPTKKAKFHMQRLVRMENSMVRWMSDDSEGQKIE